MGSIVSLTIGGIEIDWGKNNGYINHSKLFTPSDRTLLSITKDDDCEYENYGYRRTLRDAKPRLELYGYNGHTIREIFNEHKLSYPEYLPPLDIDFDTFANIIKNIIITPQAHPEEDGNYDLGEYAQMIFGLPEFADLREAVATNDRDTLSFFENLNPYIQLWLLSQNPKNLDLQLEWHTSGIIGGGWTSDEELFREWENEHSYLIITEGSSDTFVIKEAISYLRPDIKDFFKYIDMTENYPFTGTGSLFNFYQGLARIGIENKCLVIFDNDTEGLEKHQKCSKIKTLSNLKTTTLPPLPDFESVDTIGPNGLFRANINGSAVSIELFLDLEYKNSKPPIVRWSSFNNHMQCYQGALTDKEFYVSQFRKALKKPSGYDFRKLHALIDHIVSCCGSMTSQ